MKCCVKTCKNAYRSGGSKHTFFSFPKDPILFKKWWDFCNTNASYKRSVKICNDHFRADEMTGHIQCEFGLKRKRMLAEGAIPTILNKTQSGIGGEGGQQAYAQRHNDLLQVRCTSLFIDSFVLACAKRTKVADIHKYELSCCLRHIDGYVNADLQY